MSERASPPPSQAAGGSMPYALAFLASFCVMLVEMVAGRMVSLHLGASLYSWTSVIGVVLGGITLGNFVGGRLSDRYPARDVLGVLFLLGGALTLSIPLFDYQVAWRFSMAHHQGEGLLAVASLPGRVAAQVAAVFLLPATVLGTIGPVVAKWAIERGLPRGRTVGNVYAWGAFGSIVGTFAAGFYLVALLGAAGATLAAGGVLALCGLALLPYRAAGVLVALWPVAAAAVVSNRLSEDGRYREWTWRGGRPVVEERPEPGRVYTAESQYSYIKVVEDSSTGALHLCLDSLVHSKYVPGATRRLDYAYEQIYANVTSRCAPRDRGLRALFLGGGGYVFPRYLLDVWPNAAVEVAEIDPAVTEACFRAFGLRREIVDVRDRFDPASPTPAREGRIAAYHLDARNHLEDLLRWKRSSPSFVPFDFVYGDAFNDYTVPFHLVTLEFNQKVRELLRPDTGVYLLNVIDIFDVGRFLGAIRNTLSKVFPRVYIVSTLPGGPSPGPTARDTFIVIGAFRDLDLAALGERPGELPFPGSLLRPEHIWLLEARSKGRVLTDDLSPVENLLGDVVRRKLLR